MTVLSSEKTSPSPDGVIRQLQATPTIVGTPEPVAMLSDACESNRMTVLR